LWDDSKTSKELFNYFDRKYGQVVTPKAIVKACTVVSCKLESPRLNTGDIAPSRNFKTATLNDIKTKFDPAFYIDLKSDFTMNSLKNYEGELRKGKCLLINDGTEQFASKAQRTKDRLVGGLSELLSDESYCYQDFRTKFSLEGKVTVIMNMTSESYRNYKERLFATTFSERFLTLHHTLTEMEQLEWVEKEERSRKMHLQGKITEDDIETEVEIPKKYLFHIRYLAQEYSYLSLRTFIGCQDIIKATLRAHASLNKRKLVCHDDIKFVHMLRDYLIDPFSPHEGRIVKLRSQGYSISDICKILDKPNYRYQVQTVIRKATLRGILPPEKAPKRGEE
jgi:hypothetical protein